MKLKDLHALLVRIRAACHARTIAFTEYALERGEKDLEMGRERLTWDIVHELEAVDYEKSVPSRYEPFDLLHVFITPSDHGEVYVKIAEREHVLVISLHLDDP